MPRRLTGLDVREVSFVNRPANKRRFAIVKMADTFREGASMDQELRDLFDALKDDITAKDWQAAEEDLGKLLEAVQRRADEGDEGEEAEKAARRRKPDEDEDYGYPAPKRRRTKTEALVLEKAEALVQKSAGTEQALTREAAIREVIRLNPGLWEDYWQETFQG